MLVEESRTVTKVERVTIRALCDCCGRTIETWDRADREISRRDGHIDGGTTEQYDVCQSCWEDKVVRLFKTGPRIIEW